MFKVKNIILSLALLGCSGLAQAQQVEQRIDSLQILIGQQTVLHLKASVKQGDKVQLPSLDVYKRQIICILLYFY